MLRGGAFNNNEDNVRVSNRNNNNPNNVNNNCGFRLVYGVFHISPCFLGLMPYGSTVLCAPIHKVFQHVG